MSEQNKTEQQRTDEIVELRRRIAEMEKSGAESKRVEETLKESEAKYKSLFEGSHDAILLADPETGRFVDCNGKAEELSGYSRSEILCMKIGQFTPGDTKGETADEFQKLIAGKGIQKEWEILTKGGSRMPVEINTTLIRVGDKSYLQGVVRDITERKRAKETLKKGEERFRASVESLLDGFAIFSSVRNDAGQIVDFAYEYINDAGCRLSQTTRDEIIGKTFLKVDLRQKERGLFEEYVLVVETGQAFFKEVPLYEDLYGGGKRLTRAFDYRAVKLGDGFVLVWRDITSHKQTEESLRQSEERFRALVENSQDVMMMQDLDGKYLYYHGLARYGLTPADVVGETPFDLFDPVTAVRVMNQLKQVISTDHGVISEENVSWKGKSFRFLDHKYPIRDRQGNLVAVGTIARDITKRKQAEEALEKSERLLRAFLSAIKESAFVVDTQGTVIIANETLADRLGTNVNKLIGACIYNDLPAEIAGERKTQVDEVIRTGKPNRYEDQRAGMWIDSFVYPILDEEGRVANVGIIAVDITQRKQAEKALRLAEENFRRSLDDSPLGVRIVTQEGETIYANRAILEIYGYDSVEELRKTRTKDRYTPESYVEFQKRREKRQGGEDTSSEYEISIVRNSGEVRHLQVFRKGVLWNGERQFQALYSDITERKQMEEALRESEERYRSLFKNMLNGYAFCKILVDEENKPIDFIYIDVNDAFEKLAGLRKEDVIGKRVTESIPSIQDLSPELIPIYGEVASTGKTAAFEVFFKPLDIWLVISVYSPHKDYFVAIFDNITERKRAEEALRVSLQKYRVLFESFPLGITISDKSGKIIEANCQSEQLLGITREVHAQRRIDSKEWQIIRKDGTPMPVDEYASTRVLRENRLIENVEMGIVKDKGEITWISVTAAPIPLEGYGVAIAYGDITERKRIEEALKKSEALHKEAQKAGHIGHWELDTSIMVPTWSEEIFRIFGLDPQKDAPSFAAHQKVTHPDDWNILNNAVTRSINEGIPFDIDFRILRPDKTIRWMHSIGYPKRDSEGRIVSVFGTAQDITQRRESQDTLRESEERYRALFRNSFDAVLLTAPDGRILDVNEEACRIFGYTQEELRKIGRDSIVDKSDPRLTHVLEVRRRKDKFRGELHLVRKDGTKFPAEISSAIFKDKDGNLRASMIIRDITDRKRTEEEFKSTSEQLRALSAHLQSVREEERTMVAREIHDELGQALTALKMDLSWMNKKLPRDQKPLHEKAGEMSQLLDTTVKSVKRISTELRPGLLDDLGVAAAIEWQAGEFQNRTGIKCNVTVTPEEIVLDEKLSTVLFRIFQETLTNVARHSHATRVKVSLRQKATKLELKVEDNGKGITEKQISSPKSFGFIGMRERVYPWGGEVKIEGKPGKGTTVTVTIPIKKEQKAESRRQ